MKKRHRGALDHGALARQTAAKIQNSFGAHMAAGKNQLPQPPMPADNRSEGPIIPQTGGIDEDSGGSQAF